MEYLEIEQNVEKVGNANQYCGKVDRELLKKLSRKTILHNHRGGVIASQVLQVSGSKEDINAVVNSDSSIKRFDESGVQLRGLEIKSHATPTDEEVNKLHTKLRGEVGLDIAKHNSSRGKPWTTHLRENDSIGNGYWLCKHPDHAPERVKANEKCSLGHEEGNEYAKGHVTPFDVVRWRK